MNNKQKIKLEIKNEILDYLNNAIDIVNKNNNCNIKSDGTKIYSNNGTCINIFISYIKQHGFYDFLIRTINDVLQNNDIDNTSTEYDILHYNLPNLYIGMYYLPDDYGIFI